MKRLLLLTIGLFTSFLSFGQIDAVDDYIAMSSNLPFNVLTNDTLNGSTISSGQVIISVISSNTSQIGINSNGDIGFGLLPIIPGMYIINYQICDATNSLNCDTAILTINYLPANYIVANDDVMSTTSGLSGNPNIGNILSNDFFNGNVPSISNVNLSIISPAIAINGSALIPEINLTTGIVSVPAGTPAGNYNITYEICAIPNPTFCDTAVVTIPVSGTIIDANNDTYNNVIGFLGNTNIGNVLVNDTNNGIPVLLTTINLTEIVNSGPISSGLPYPSISAYGNVNVPQGTPAGTYTITYQICELLNPVNCDVAQVTINVIGNTTNTGVGVFLTANNSVIPGFNHYLTLTYANFGTTTVTNGTLTYTKDSSLSLTNSSVVVTPTSNGFTYNYTNLLPGEVRQIALTFLVPTIPTVSLNQVITNNATITPTDSYPNDNSSSLSEIVIGSYDPNDKQENHSGEIVFSTFTSNDFLTYTIRFENTGTANAQNIRVEDLIDSNKLEINSLKMIASSHSNILTRNGNNVIWLFNNVNLPPSVANSEIGHGYISFQIKPKPGYAIGDIIPNTATIYFDFNPAIVTNTCNTEFVTALSNTNFAFNNFNYYPNPVKNSLSISNGSTITEIEITSLLGQKIMSKKVNDLQTEINLSVLSKGIYFVKVMSDGQEKTVKIIKE